MKHSKPNRNLYGKMVGKYPTFRLIEYSGYEIEYYIGARIMFCRRLK